MMAFLVRLVGYAVVFGLTYRAAQTMWTQYGLDEVAALQGFHQSGLVLLAVAPLVCAFVGVGVLRSFTVFVASALCGAALTAPFVLARVSGV